MQGEVLLGVNQFDDALVCLEEAAALFAQLEEPETESHVWAKIAAAYDGLHDARAMAAWSRARRLWHQLGIRVGELEALEGLAAAARRHSSEPGVALAYYREAVQLAQALNDHAVEGRLRNTLGILEWDRGEYAQALQHYERAFTLFGDLQNTASAGLMLNSIAVTLGKVGRVREAQLRFEEAVALHRTTGQHQLEGHALAALGDISAGQGETERAVEYYSHSLDIRRDMGDHRGEGWMLFNLARCDVPGRRADEWLLQASEIAKNCDDLQLVAACDTLRPDANH
jgi:tetratricopeptide (TPR) repeat protein